MILSARRPVDGGPMRLRRLSNLTSSDEKAFDLALSLVSCRLSGGALGGKNQVGATWNVERQEIEAEPARSPNRPPRLER
jgi:hypothetical protein